MSAFIARLHEFSFLTTLLRLCLAVAAGGIVGWGRTKKKRVAGFRTYMLTSIGAALAMLLANYEYAMLQGLWAPAVQAVGLKFDASRYGAAVLQGIGFLGAGTIMATIHQQVSGLSTATGLFASACMGLASGAGFYECVLITLLMLVFVLDIMGPMESAFKRRVRNMTLHVEFESIEDLSQITQTAQEHYAQIFEIDVERTKKEGDLYPSAVIDLKMARAHTSHSEMLSSVAELPCVVSVQELIS